MLSSLENKILKKYRSLFIKMETHTTQIIEIPEGHKSPASKQLDGTIPIILDEQGNPHLDYEHTPKLVAIPIERVHKPTAPH